ncbi:MAG: hypothetical protein M3Q45_12895, partial [Chloroflexota bacterium]|nr:hypothetical protein [Chloroflexota bacterium]
LNRHYLAIEPDAAQILTQAIGSGTRLIPPVRIEAGSVIGADCVIGPYVTIEQDCHIGAGVQIVESIILRQAQIAAGRQVVGEVVIGD